MTEINIFKSNDKYKNLLNFGSEFVFEDEDKNEDEVNDKRENDININKTRYKQPIIIKKKQETIRPENNNKFSFKPFVINYEKQRQKLSDEEGLRKAYDNNVNNIYVAGDTMFISGTKHAESLIDTMITPTTENIYNHYRKGHYQDVWDDLKIPFYMTHKSERFRNVQEELDKNPNITKVVGHSLGSAVAYEAQKRNPNRNLSVVAYSAPVVSFPWDKSGNERSRNILDPIAIFDNGARTKINTEKDFYNPHSFSNTSENTYTANLELNKPQQVTTRQFVNQNSKFLTE